MAPALSLPTFLTHILSRPSILLLLLVISTHVAADAPALVINPAYTVIEETTLYIQGGSDSATGRQSNQFYSLDLTQSSWNAANPPWKVLNSLGAPTDFSHSIVSLNNTGDFIVWGPVSGISTYTKNTWSTVPLPANASVTNGLEEVYDPTTGLIYVPAGGNAGKNMLQFNPQTLNRTLLPIPTTFGGNSVVHYTAAWSKIRNSILMYGGFYSLNANVSSPNLFEYDPKTAAWSLVSTSGPSPGDVRGHCMASAYNGTKFILFGGQTSTRQPLGGIYTLDITSMTWTKGTDINPSLNRNGMACAVSGDFFIAWGGGQGGTNVPALATPAIYNMVTKLWVGSVGTGSESTPPNPVPTNPSGEKSSNVPVIAGAAGGAVVLIAIVAFVIIRRRKSSSIKKNPIADGTGRFEGSGGSETHSVLLGGSSSPTNESTTQYEPSPIRMERLSHQANNTGRQGYNYDQHDYYHGNQSHAVYTQGHDQQLPYVQPTGWNQNYNQAAVSTSSFTTPPPSAGWTHQQQSFPTTASTTMQITPPFIPPKPAPSNPQFLPITTFDSVEASRNPQLY